MTEESRDHATPNGGVKSTAYYLDDAGQPAEKDVATQMRIVEYNDAGEPIFRTYGKLNRPTAPAAPPA